MDLPKRKPTRLKKYDYSSQGYYFITICTHNKQCILSKITVGEGLGSSRNKTGALPSRKIVGEGLAPPEIKLSQYGEIANQELLNLEERYSNIKIDKYVIMPNHIHAIFIIQNAAGASPCPTISDIICTFKSLVTRKCHFINSDVQIWQRSFHDHIIRGEKDYSEIWEYIENNTAKWVNDKFYT